MNNKNELTKTTTVKTLSSYTPEQAKEYQMITRDLQPGNIKSILEFGKDINMVADQAMSKVLETVKRSNAGEAGKVLADLMVKISHNKLEDPGRASSFKRQVLKFFPFLKPVLSDYEKFISQYDSVASNFDQVKAEVEKITLSLKQHYEESISICESMGNYAGQLDKLIEAGYYKMAEIDQQLEDGKDTLSDIEKQRLISFKKSLEFDLVQKKQSKIQLESSATQNVIMMQDCVLMAQKASRLVTNTIPQMKQNAAVIIKAMQMRYYHEQFKALDESHDKLMSEAAESVHDVSVDIAKQVSSDDTKFETLMKSIENNKRTINEVNNILNESNEKRLDGIKKLQQAAEEMKKAVLESNRHIQQEAELFEGKTIVAKELRQ